MGGGGGGGGGVLVFRLIHYDLLLYCFARVPSMPICLCYDVCHNCPVLEQLKNVISPLWINKGSSIKLHSVSLKSICCIALQFCC